MKKIAENRQLISCYCYPGINLTYLANLGIVSMAIKFFFGTPGIRQKFVSKKKNILAMFKCTVSMTIHNDILLIEGVPT